MNIGFRIILLNFALLTRKDGLVLIHPNGVSLMTKRLNSILFCKRQWQSGLIRTFTQLRLPKTYVG